ncbi:beta-1,3-galactosyltransferase 5-like [Diaphorina citri]|uniref:Hexosyltransferase n=1 Tax=Diaphorina citri TaxID=121845 RepID=A0A1S3D2Q4_DIACI|nr:beta-1,3-galactosyltransferase 5-like [Diaphorina citri]
MHVLKLDDDVFMNVIQLDELLTRTLSPHGTRNLLMCSIVWEKSPVLRTYRSKWRVSFSEYRDHFYPPHCHGNALLYSPDVVFKLYQHLQTDQEYFWVDDVFITGIVFSKLNLTHAKFSWWPGHDEPIVSLFNNWDLRKYDPHKTLFALLWEPDFVSKYKYMYKATYLNTSLLES